MGAPMGQDSERELEEDVFQDHGWGQGTFTEEDFDEVHDPDCDCEDCTEAYWQDAEDARDAELYQYGD